MMTAATMHEQHCISAQHFLQRERPARDADGLQVCNRSKVTCLVSFAQAAQQLAQHAVELAPAGDVTIPAKDAVDVTFFYRCAHVLPLHPSTSQYTHTLRMQVASLLVTLQNSRTSGSDVACVYCMLVYKHVIDFVLQQLCSHMRRHC